MHHRVRLLLILPFLLLAIPLRADTDSSEVAKSRATVRAAVTTLRQEYEAKPTALRTRCDYFIAQSDAPDIPPEAIVAALADLPGPPRMQAYVGWQLLSGLPPKVEGAVANRLCQVYRSAPAPIPHPGLAGEAQREFTQRIARLSPDAVPESNEQWQQMVQTTMAGNDMILKYRDELQTRLPATTQTVMAAFQDAWSRAAAGVPADDAMQRAMQFCRLWAVNSPPPADLQTILNMLMKMDQILSTPHAFPPSYIESITLDPHTHRAAAKTITGRFITSKNLKPLIDFVRDALENPGGGLKFKTEN